MGFPLGRPCGADRGVPDRYTPVNAGRRRGPWDFEDEDELEDLEEQDELEDLEDEDELEDLEDEDELEDLEDEDELDGPDAWACERGR
jgi:hypothetical protein